ncbi:hypothetical protein PR202_ga14016 [Eleusine coracana subsp. coracana]|uniref:Thylakoid soluble phosphoprotein n=1 Tax=Eleusine coracana subsp. coracana TaxID=191504 RepID=A0AAV5CG57_ELECO|nr:hypothetical protein PR202_ga14016 [Eleusine coracana subsp. coracana]
MASVGFGSSTVAAAAVAPASSSAAGRTRPRRSVLAVPAATRAGQAAAAKEEKSFGDFIFGLIFKENQLVETDPLLNKVEGGGPAPRSAIPRAKNTRGGTTGGKKPDDNGGGFNLGGLFAKKE